MCSSVYLLLLALLLPSWISEYSSFLVFHNSSKKLLCNFMKWRCVFFSGFACCFCILLGSWAGQRWWLCPWFITQPSAERCCSVFRDQPAGVPEVSGTMVDLWYVSSSHAKKGLWGALVTPRLYSGSWGSLGCGSPNSCLEYEVSSSYDQEICPSFFQFL